VTFNTVKEQSVCDFHIRVTDPAVLFLKRLLVAAAGNCRLDETFRAGYALTFVATSRVDTHVIGSIT
jgi:hypothetical protein